MGCDCGKPKCDGHCGVSPAVLQINNPSECVLFHRVEVPASMGDSKTNPPKSGAYKNVLLYYEADQTSWLYSSDGVPQKLVNGLTDYEDAIHLPQINGVTLLGNKNSADLKLADAPMVITIASGNTSWSGADTAEDIYNFFLGQGKVNVVFEGSENYGYEIVSAAYIPGEQKMMCMTTVASVDTGSSPVDFSGNALYGLMTFYTVDKAVDVGELDLQPKLSITDFTGLNMTDGYVLEGVPATSSSIGMVKPGDGLEVASDGTLTVIDHVFDTVADMKSATNLVNGSYAQTLGFHTINDGGGALYKISDTGTADEMYVIAVGDLYANLIIQDYITPEVLGAYGDNTHDDTSAVQACLSNIDYLHSVLSKDYKISSALTVPDYKVVDGGGKIHSSGTCFELDGKNHLTIKDLKLYPQLHGIHITSTSGHSNYNLFENIFCYGANTTDSKGLFIEITTSYINEFTYRNCVFWNFKYGIYALNDAGSQEMTKHTFYDCSSETSKTAGQYIKNGSGFCFYNCRHVESISNIWITEGTCDELLIVGGAAWFNNTSNMQFSDDTNGQVIGGLRYAGVGNNRSARNGNIVNGKVVPKVDAISTARINVTADMTINYGSQLYLYYNFNTAVDCTLTLPTECYGGEGKINEFYVRTSKADNTSTVVIGGVTKVLPVGTHVYRFTLNTAGGGTNWLVEEIVNAV